jgi:hypothetical protein
MRQTMLARYDTHEVDNRDAGEMFEYLEARIESMKRRITELERENETLRLIQFGMLEPD